MNIVAYRISEQEFRNKVTWFFFLMACFVVVRHAVNIDVYGLNAGVLYGIERGTAAFTDLMVPTFFVISGYLFFQNFTYDKLISKWKTRIFSLVIPYLIWNLLAHLYYLMIGMVPCIANTMNSPPVGFSFCNLLSDVILGGRNVTWFIKYLILFVVLSPLLWLVLKRKILGPVLLSGLLFIGYWFHNDYVDWLSVFLFGGWVGSCYRDAVRLRHSYTFNIGAAVALVVTVGAEIFCPEAIIGWYYILRIIQAILIWLSTDCLAIDGIISGLFRISFFIFVAHSMVLESIEKLFLIVLGKNAVGAWLDFFCAPLLTVILVELSALCLKKCFPRFWLVVNGTRSQDE